MIIIVKSIFMCLMVMTFSSLTARAGILLDSSHLIYEGAFRVPYPNLGGDSGVSRTLGGRWGRIDLQSG